MSLRRTLRVLRLEVSHQLHRPLVWIWMTILALLVLAGWWQASNLPPSARRLLTSEFSQTTAVVQDAGVFFLFFVAIAAGRTVLQDDEYRVGALLHATSLRVSEYIWGKFAGVMTVVFAVTLLQVGLRLIADFCVPPPSAIHLIGEFNLMNYLRPILVFILPFNVSAAGISFALAERTRRGVVVGLWPITLVLLGTIVFWAPPEYQMDPTWNRVLMLIDPLGYRWVWDQALYTDLGTDFYNTQPVRLDSMFILSRVLWVVVGLGAVASSARHHARVLRGTARVRSVGKPDEPEREVVLPVPKTPARAPSVVRTAVAVCFNEVRALQGQAGVVVFVPFLLVLLLLGIQRREGAYAIRPLLTSGYLAASSFDLLTGAIGLFLLFTVIESLERERACKLDLLQPALPFPTAGLLLGKYLANLVIAALILGLALAVCAAVSWSSDAVSFELEPFLMLWGALLAPTLVAWAAFLLAVRAASGRRHFAYGAGLAVLVWTFRSVASSDRSWLDNWTLIGAVGWTDLGAFEVDAASLLWNRLLILGTVPLFWACAILFFERRKLERTPRGRWLRLLPWCAPPLIALAVLHHRVRDSADGPAVHQTYRAYGQLNSAAWRDAPLPAVHSVELEVDLEPEQHRFHAKGVLDLFNHQRTTLTEVPLTGALHWEELRWTMDGEPAAPEDRAKLFVFRPKRPLEPGDHLRIGFEFSEELPHSGTKAGTPPIDVVLPSSIAIGTHGEPTIVPQLGYNEELALLGLTDADRDAAVRALQDRPGQTRALIGTDLPFHTSIRVTAPAEYTINSVGALVSESVSGGRRTVHWKSNYPVYLFSIIAGRWDVRRGLTTAVFHHPGHTRNLDQISGTLEAAHRYYSEWFGSSSLGELKLSEMRGGSSVAMGYPTNIMFAEELGFLAEPGDANDPVSNIVAHEAAHQWWGVRLIPSRSPGATIVVEGMANYSALLLMEQLHGSSRRIQNAKAFEEHYLRSRSSELERPLVNTAFGVRSEQSVGYEKGALALWRLHTLIGREAMFAGLREFLQLFEGQAAHPSLEDLLRVLRTHAPDQAAYDELVSAWFYEVVIPRYRVTDAKLRAESTEDTWSTALVLENMGTGRLPVDIAVARGARFTPDYREARSAVTIGAGERRTLEITSPFRPERIVVDPDALVLQLERRAAEVSL